MKKYIRNIVFTAALSIALTLTACSGNSGSSVTDSVQSGTQESEPQEGSSTEEASAPQEEPQTSAPEQSQTEEAPVESGETADLQAIYDKINAAVNASGELVMLPESDPMMIDSFYSGLSEVNTKQQLLYMAPVTGFACEVMLVEAEDSGSADKAAEIFRARIELGASDEFYPDTAAAWQQNAQVQRSGNLVCMIALPEGYSIPDDIFAL